MIVKGTLYYKDRPQVHLSVNSSANEFSSETVCDNPILPFEFRVRGINEESLELFLEDRVMPSERQSMRSVLEWAGLPFYDKDLIATANYFASCNDDFWIKPDDDDSITWEEIQKR